MWFSAQNNGVPVLVKDVGAVAVGFRPRLGILGRDKQDDVVGAIVVLRSTEKTAEMIPKVEAAIDKLNHDGSLPPGVKVVPFYDRSSLDRCDHAHCAAQPDLRIDARLPDPVDFPRDLRSAIIVGLNIPFALFFATILLVLRGESANLLSVGAVDFGIIVDSAVILVENVFRNLQRDQGEKNSFTGTALRGSWGPDPTRSPENSAEPQVWTDRLRLILISAMQVDKAVLFSALITVAGFVPLFTMQGVEGQIFGPMARTYGYALAGALIATFTITPPLASVLSPRGQRDRDDRRPGTASPYAPALRFALTTASSWWESRSPLSLGTFFVSHRASGANFSRIWRKAISGFAPPCRSRSPCMTARRPRGKCARFFFGIRRSSRSSPSMAGRMTAATPRPSPMWSCSRR